MRQQAPFGITGNRLSLGDGSRHWDLMKNGLYSIHVSLQDGRVGKGSGVIVFRDGKIVGGDAYLFYTGTYTVKDDTFRGEVLVQRHTTPATTTTPCSVDRPRSASASPARSPTRAR